MHLQPLASESMQAEGDVSETPQLAYEEAPTTRFHALVSLVAAGGQFSDGYSLGTVGIALSLAHGTLHLPPLWLGLLGSASLAGLFFGSLLLGPLADRIGRRPMFVPTMALFAIVSLLQFFVTASWQLLVLRLLLGLILGIDYVVCCVVVAEFAPLRTRGRLLALLVFMWAVGYALAFTIGALLKSAVPDSWRWIIASGAIPSAVIFLGRLRIPESPLWLLQHGKRAAARQIIDRYIGRNVRLPAIASAASQAANTAWKELFGPRYRRRTAVGAVFYTGLVIPYFAVGTFIPFVFAALGIRDTYVSGVVFNTFLLLGSGFGLWLIDRVTRRQYLIGSFYIAAAALLFLVLAGNVPPFVIVADFALFAFVISVATNQCYVYLPELFPTRLRASGVGIGTAASRIGSTFGTFLLPLSMTSIGVRPSLALCVAVLVAGGVFCHLFAPETQGRSIEEA